MHFLDEGARRDFLAVVTFDTKTAANRPGMQAFWTTPPAEKPLWCGALTGSDAP